jgi:hypothetical protein
MQKNIILYISQRVIEQGTMVNSIFWLVALMGCFPSSAISQTCPTSVEASTIPNKPVSGWAPKSNANLYQLAGMTIISGALASSESDLEEKIIPISRGNDHLWSFDRPIGNIEIWMQCYYRDTSLTLSARINSDAVECFVRRQPAKKSAANVVAMCVNTSGNLSRSPP